VLIRGDISANGAVDKYDYIMLKRICLNTYKPDHIDTRVSDINEDDKINAFDYILVKRHVLGTIDIFK
jgi:hypothetical protein